MKALIKLLLLTVVLAAKTASGAWLDNGPMKVTRILDGDTIEVTVRDDYSGLFKNYRIRLNGIDAPEKSQPYGQRSRQYLADMIGGEEVMANSRGEDRYGRILGDVMIKQCKPACVISSVNETMVRAGMAWAYRYKGKAASDEMLSLEKQARASSAGLWADAQPVEPWRYRSIHKGDNQ